MPKTKQPKRLNEATDWLYGFFEEGREAVAILKQYGRKP